MTPTGVGEMLLNQQVVSGRTPVRSGDVLRISYNGPDLTFRIVSHTAEQFARIPVKASITAPANQNLPHSEPPVKALQPVASVPVREEKPAGPSTVAAKPFRRTILVAGCLAAAMLLVFATGYFFTPRPVSPAKAEETSKTDRIKMARERYLEFKAKQGEEKQRDLEKTR